MDLIAEIKAGEEFRAAFARERARRLPPAPAQAAASATPR
jgi:hypothetical protein